MMTTPLPDHRQSPPMVTKKPKGLGLGLYISRQLATSHGGELTVESTLGAGSTFSLWLPCAETAIAGSA